MLTAPAEAQTLVELIAGPLRLGENVKGALSRVARATGLPDRRIGGIWHQEARSIRAEEMDRLRQAARDARAMERARDELRAVTALITACDAPPGVRGSHRAGEADPPMGSRSGAMDRPLAAGV